MNVRIFLLFIIEAADSRYSKMNCFVLRIPIVVDFKYSETKRVLKILFQKFFLFSH